ncbi:MAG: ribosome-binding factor A [bacterium]|nr:ribosome-binding factor A [bacterium]
MELKNYDCQTFTPFFSRTRAKGGGAQKIYSLFTSFIIHYFFGMTLRQEKLNTLFKKLIAKFIVEHAEDALVAITNCIVSADVGVAHVFITVYPEKMRDNILSNLRRERRELMNFLKKNTRMKALPRITFVLDAGEIHRQKIDTLLQE